MSMTTLTKQFVIPTPRLRSVKKDKRPYFFHVAKKHIRKKKKSTGNNLSRDIDKILYGT